LAVQADLQRLTILGIDEQERCRLVKDLAATGVKVQGGQLNDQHLRDVLPDIQVMIHCTPVGMSPKVDATCVPAALLRPTLTVMDIVYNPRETRLLQEAKAAGCRVIPGLDMFLNQAVEQFELWTGQKAPAAVMRRVLESKFG
jgi:shikimate dehydrogenase